MSSSRSAPNWNSRGGPPTWNATLRLLWSHLAAETITFPVCMRQMALLHCMNRLNHIDLTRSVIESLVRGSIVSLLHKRSLKLTIVSSGSFRSNRDSNRKPALWSMLNSAYSGSKSTWTHCFCFFQRSARALTRCSFAFEKKWMW